MTGVSGVVRDERTAVVEHAGYWFAYLFIFFALLVDVMYRGTASQKAAWELLAIVILAGAISTIYQWWHKILTRQSFKVAVATFIVAGIVATLVAAFRVLK